MLELIPYPLVIFLLAIVPFRGTCYYFHGWYWDRIRQVRGEKIPQYKKCEECPYGNTSIDSYHRYFARAAFLIAFFIHLPISLYHILIPESAWVELFSIASVSVWVGEYAHAMMALFSPSMYDPQFTLFNFTELVDSLFLLAYVFSCHAIRFSFGSGDRKISSFKQGILNFQTKLNDYHGLIFWISLVTVSIHSALIVAINLGLL